MIANHEISHVSFFGGLFSQHAGRSYFTAASLRNCKIWNWVNFRSRFNCFAYNNPAILSLYCWDDLAIFIRGYACYSHAHQASDLEQLAHSLRSYYLDYSELDVDYLDGNFTIALIDSSSCRVILYRNLIGLGSTYYYSETDSFCFGGNLAQLSSFTGLPRLVNNDALPSLFLFRCIPGRETLLKGYYRLLPGEEVRWEQGTLRRRQRHTFANLKLSFPLINAVEADDAIHATMTEVLRDCASHRPSTVNLLSGGVDSSYLQAIWNTSVATDSTLLRSFCISIDHPTTWADTNYAVSASQQLGSHHQLIPANDSYFEYMRDALELTAEPLNHVQSAYFGHLARHLHKQGVRAALCGEGADSLFGVSLANQIHNAQTLQSVFPFGRRLRNFLATVCDHFGFKRLGYTFRLADYLDDDSWLHHPINRVAMFSDLDTVQACFGNDSIQAAFRGRTSLVDQLQVGPNPLQRLHAAGLLGEATDSAGLWSTLFQTAGVDLLCPFLDSRILRLAWSLPEQVRFPYRQPKEILKRALAKLSSRQLAYRPKLGFGQPIFEWLAPGGQLHPYLEHLGRHSFVSRPLLQQMLKTPNWFLYTLLVYDTWHRTIIESPAQHPFASLSPSLSVAS